MASVNKVHIIGNVTRDVETRYTPSGSAVCNISVATSRYWKDKQSGDRVEESEFHRVSLFDRLAEIAGEYLKKGSPVYIEGRLKTRKWQDKDGKDNYTTEILAESLQLLGSRDSGGDRSGEQQRGNGGNNRDNAPRGGDQRGNAPRGNQQRTSHEDNLRGGRQQQQSSAGYDDLDADIPF